ncbi:MAG: efflux RND transporter periplasmic adaptor subunit [bacterium]|nr:MAG: efflux RND transporter periplasmic adaptor subunit [bacterium]
MNHDHPQSPPLSRRPGTGRLRGGLWIAGAVTLTAGLLLYMGSGRTQEEEGKGKPPAGAPRGMLVEAATARVMSVSREITAVGTLTSNESVVVSAEIAGRVVDIAFSEGQRAKAGQVLVRLDRSILEAQRDRAEASLTLSRANRDRAEVLLREEAISQREWDEASAQWRLDEASLRLAQAQLDKTVLRAPFDGALGLRHVSVGEYVQPGQPIVTLDDTDPIKLDFRVPEVFSARLQAGQGVQVQVDAAPGRTFSGKVYAIDPKVDPTGRSLQVRARVPNAEGSLRPGMFAQVRLVMEERPDALMIPEQALISQGQSQFVYKVVEGVVVEVPVSLGLRQRGLVEITDGLSPGDTVITAGQIKVRPGVPVTIAPAAGGN